MWVLHPSDWRPASWDDEGDVGGAGDARAIGHRAIARFLGRPAALDSRDGWQTSLSASTWIVLSTPAPMTLLWGPALMQIYNDGFRDFLAWISWSGTTSYPALAAWSLCGACARCRSTHTRDLDVGSSARSARRTVHARGSGHLLAEAVRPRDASQCDRCATARSRGAVGLRRTGIALVVRSDPRCRPGGREALVIRQIRLPRVDAPHALPRRPRGAGRTG